MSCPESPCTTTPITSTPLRMPGRHLHHRTRIYHATPSRMRLTVNKHHRITSIRQRTHTLRHGAQRRQRTRTHLSRNRGHHSITHLTISTQNLRLTLRRQHHLNINSRTLTGRHLGQSTYQLKHGITKQNRSRSLILIMRKKSRTLILRPIKGRHRLGNTTRRRPLNLTMHTLISIRLSTQIIYQRTTR